MEQVKYNCFCCAFCHFEPVRKSDNNWFICTSACVLPIVKLNDLGKNCIVDLGKIRCVLFDIGGVMVFWNGRRLYDLVSSESGLQPDMVKTEAEKIIPDFQNGKISERYFWHTIGKGLNAKTLDGTRSFFKEAYRREAKINQFVLKKVLDCKRYGLLTAILSNTVKPIVEVLGEWGLVNRFDYAFFSCDLGVSKPQKEVFDYVTNKMFLPAEQIVFVDDKDSNIISASSLGFNTVKYTDNCTLHNKLQKLVPVNLEDLPEK